MESLLWKNNPAVGSGSWPRLELQAWWSSVFSPFRPFRSSGRAASIRHCPCAASAHVHKNSWIFIYKEMSISFISLTVFYRLVSWKSSWKTGTWCPRHYFLNREYQFWDLKISPFAPDLKYVVNRPMTQWFIFDRERSFLILPVDFDRNQLDSVESAAGVDLGPRDWSWF